MKLTNMLFNSIFYFISLSSSETEEKMLEKKNFININQTMVFLVFF